MGTGIGYPTRLARFEKKDNAKLRIFKATFSPLKAAF